MKFDLPPEYTVPHMGWNQLDIRRRPPILEGLQMAPTPISSTPITWSRKTPR